MSGTKLNNFTTADVNLTAIMNTLTQATKGHFKLSITEFTTTALPAIAAGSIIEVDGAMFKFDADEAITGTPTDGVVYIKLVPSVTACTAEFTNTAPVWDDSKQGWYGVTGYGAHRYIVKLILTAGVYTNKIYMSGAILPYLKASVMTVYTVTGTWNANTERVIDVTFPFNPIAITALELLGFNGTANASGNDKGNLSVSSFALSGLIASIGITTGYANARTSGNFSLFVAAVG